MPCGVINCVHSEVCGGCSQPGVSYGEQLRAKKKLLAETLAPFTQQPPEIIASPEIFRYRNKMELSFSRQPVQGSEPLEFEQCMGLKSKKRWDKVFNLAECFLAPESLGPLAEAVRAWAKRTGEPFYDLRRHTGNLRHLLVRKAKNTGEALVMLFAADWPKDVDGLAEAVGSAMPEADVIVGLNKKLSDSAQAEEIRVIKGKGFITEKIRCGGRTLAFRVSPGSFFQTNTRAAELAFAKIREIAAGFSPDKIFDLYGGSGAFSLVCADSAREIISVEAEPKATADGKANAGLNGIKNVSFVNAKTEDFIETADLAGSLVILDPPRCGLHPRALKKIAEAKPEKIVYLSCNPKSLARDLPALGQSYRMVFAEGFDFFPHTGHVEILTELALNESL